MTFPDLPHLRQLQNDLWCWPQSRSAVMVGAGLSLNAEPLPGVTTHFPTWRQLVRAMFDELHPPQPGETSEEVLAWGARFNSSNGLRIASEYEAAFGAQKLDQLIRTQNPDSDYQPGKLHHLLLRLPWADVFTTNYDTLLERTEVPGRTYQVVAKASELTTAFSPRIVKLHGSFPSQTPFIISEDDYRTYPRKFAPFVNSVQQCLLENSFVLIGFSGDDPNFLEWTGWIRDELGGHHAPIYLVGPLSLGNAERSLLAQRGVTPIDLSPVFARTQPPNGLQAASIEWFLKSLLAARPPRREGWPELDRSAEQPSNDHPSLIDDGLVIPEEAGLVPDPGKPLTAETFSKVMARWQFERFKYPGWVVAPDDKRSYIWERTKYWIWPLVNFAKEWPAAARILLFREINWRLETAMVPLFTDWIKVFEEAINELAACLADNGLVDLSIGLVPTGKPPKAEVADAWLEIAFGLLREARETYNADRWKDLKAKIDRVVQRHPHQSDRNQYETTLWAMWNLERESAKTAISGWEPSPRFPLASMWKAGLLAELDDPGEARAMLRTALSEIRRGLRSQGQSIELLSLEGWCTYLLFGVETSLDFARRQAVREEFCERWQELKRWDCSPWPLMEYFEQALSVSQPKPPRTEEEIRGFDPGQTSVSYHLGSDTIGPYLPAFGCIRLFEQAGVPMRLPRVNLVGDALMNACRWVAPFISFWSPALLIRADKGAVLREDLFLSRTRVAEMNADLAKRLHNWCLGILQRELSAFTGSITAGSAQESLLEVLPEVLSRLAFKADPEQLKKAFPLALQLHALPAVRSHIRLHEVCAPWFRRIFEAAEGVLLLEWLPILIRAPLFERGISPHIPPSATWPDPMGWFLVGPAREARHSHPDLVSEIEKATDWLLRRAASEDGDARRRALDRLIDLFFADLMTTTQRQRFGELLWSQKATTGLPDLPHHACFGFLHLPAPPDVDVHRTIKQYLLGLPVPTFVTRDAAGKITGVQMGRRYHWIREVSDASKPIIYLRGEANGALQWTPDESRKLYAKARAWWASDKDGIAVKDFGASPVLEALADIGSFLSRAVIPTLQPIDPACDELVAWLAEIRGLGAFPSVALPYVLGIRPNQAEDVTNTLAADLGANVRHAVAAAADAVRHWIYIADAGRAPTPPPQLLAALIDRVVFRCKPDIASCLKTLAYLIFERPQAISPQQGSLLATSLMAWHEATILHMSSEQTAEFQENERPELRRRVGALAGALHIWFTKFNPSLPQPPGLDLWEKSCASDPLPEVRHAFAAWDRLQP
jgi:hypothetical protein